MAHGDGEIAHPSSIAHHRITVTVNPTPSGQGGQEAKTMACLSHLSECSAWHVFAVRPLDVERLSELARLGHS